MFIFFFDTRKMLLTITSNGASIEHKMPMLLCRFPSSVCFFINNLLLLVLFCFLFFFAIEMARNSTRILEWRSPKERAAKKQAKKYNHFHLMNIRKTMWTEIKNHLYNIFTADIVLKIGNWPEMPGNTNEPLKSDCFPNTIPSLCLLSLIAAAKWKTP